MNSPPRVPLSLNRSLDPPESSGSPTQPCEDSSIQNFHRGYARAMNMRASPESETFAGGSSERFKERGTLGGLFTGVCVGLPELSPGLC